MQDGDGPPWPPQLLLMSSPGPLVLQPPAGPGQYSPGAEITATTHPGDTTATGGSAPARTHTRGIYIEILPDINRC